MAELVKKLRIAEGTPILTVNAPRGYANSLGKLPAGAHITDKRGKSHPFIHWFVQTRDEMESQLKSILKILPADGLLWISFPKTTSGIQTDLSRDKGWDALLKLNLRWLSMISFDDSWSAFLMQNAPPHEQTRASKEYHNNSVQYADTKTKTVTVPEDFAAAMAKSKKAKTHFESLSFTNRKEYVMWIVGAKREVTRTDRLKKSIDKLLAGKKNPSEK